MKIEGNHIKKSKLLALRRLHGNLYEAYRRWWNRLWVAKYLIFPLKAEKVFVVGTPLHTNIGDSAIALAEIAFLQECGIPKSKIKELTVPECQMFFSTMLRRIGPQDRLYLHGGGNMGDQWLNEELFRRKVMDAFPGNPMVIFPQTIFYTDTETGSQEQTNSISYYNGREGLTLIAREQKSYDIMRLLYPDTPVLLTPDIVLSATMDVFGAKKQERKGVLLCMREDAEQAMSQNERCEVKTYLNECGYAYRITDMYSDCPVTKENRADCVRRKMNEFTGAELVITDRLHGMVFAAITGTPCIVFSNYNHKVRGTYEWIKYLPYIKYAESVEEAKKYVPELLTMKDCRYDNTPLKPYFDRLAEIVKEKGHLSEN